MKTNFILLFAFLIWMNSLYSQSINEDNIINRHLQNNAIANSFIASPNDSCYLIFNNALYLKLNSKGDSWDWIVDQINTISIDPKNSKLFYAIDDKNKVYKSMEGGKHWIEIKNGLPSNIKFNKLLINPHNNNEVFLTSSNGIYKTSDAGFSWQLLRGENDATQLLIDSTDKNKFYALSSQGIILSVDEGLTWKNISNTLPKKLVKGVGRTAQYSAISVYRILNANYPNSQFLFAFTEKGIYKTNDDGKTWNELNNGFSPNIIVSSIFLTNDEILLGGGEVNKSTGIMEPRIFKSDIFATKWQKVEINSDIKGMISGIYKEKEHPGIFIQSNNRIAYIDTSLNVIGLNYGVTSHSNVIAFNIAQNGNSSIQYAFVTNSDNIDTEKWGLWQSVNNGISWSNCNIGNCKGYGHGLSKIYISPFNPLEIWAFDSNMYCNYSSVSIDGGKSWLNVFGSENIYDFSFDPKNKNIVYFTKSIGYNVYGLFRFDRTTSGSTMICGSTLFFEISKDNNKNIITQDLKLSNDGGWTWNSIDRNRIKSLFVNYDIDNFRPQFYNGNIIVLSAYKFLTTSNDNGETWQVLKSFEGEISSVYLNPINSKNIIVTTKYWNEDTFKNEYSVLQTMDGLKWDKILNFIPPPGTNNDSYSDYYRSAIMTNYAEKKNIYVYGKAGLLSSDSNGETWQKIGGINEN